MMGGQFRRSCYRYQISALHTIQRPDSPVTNETELPVRRTVWKRVPRNAILVLKTQFWRIEPKTVMYISLRLSFASVSMPEIRVSFVRVSMTEILVIFHMR